MSKHNNLMPNRLSVMRAVKEALRAGQIPTKTRKVRLPLLAVVVLFF